MNSIELDSEDITKNTVMKSNNETSNDTTNKWVRNCPRCNIEISYKYKNNFKKATAEKKICRICAATGKTPHNKLSITDLDKNCPKCNKIIEYNSRCALLRSLRNNTLCKHCSNLTYPNYTFDPKEWNKSCPNCGKLQTYKTREAFKDAIILNSKCLKCATKESFNRDSIKKQRRERSLGQHTPNFNSYACTYFDSLNVQNNWNLQHALNGGEIRVIGYSLDAYDKERNIVVEYDEPAHYNNVGQLKQKDVLRQERIITHLGCKFFRYNERTKELYEVKQS